ncbi:hypothetical protein MSAN_02463700 [Mycena sanguinolenta]|uniref:Transmembrane protein n=1 Tax=Mycena sanguinolenta TaxID=230812 RepID=A0A8H6WWW0_9AGAR|nr:hypothetical protein MSAN_02463700 [Mycena sanguinolenta]
MFRTRASPRSFALVFYLFSQLASCAVIVRRPAVIIKSQSVSTLGGGITNPVTTGLQVLLVGQQSASLSASTATFTTTSFVPTTISGEATFVPTTILSTGITFVPVPTGQSKNSDSGTASTRRAGAIVGGVVGVALLLLGGVILLLRAVGSSVRSGSPSKDVEQSMPSPLETSVDDPFVDANRESWVPYVDGIQTGEHALTRSDTVSTRQLHISDQVHRAKEQVAELEEMSSLLLRSSIASSAPEYTSRPGSGAHEAAADEQANVYDADDSEALGVQDKLEHALQQIEGLKNRIQELEMQRRSSWALGLSDVPPPGYSE